jgi:signal transduction histidine kinase
MSATVETTSPTIAAERIEELGRIIMAYSEVTDKLQQSHEVLQRTVQALQDELGEKNRQLERKNRLAAIGEMAAGMAHEIRNPLGGIQLYASMLAKDVAGQPPAEQLVQKIAGGVRRLEALVSQVLQFSREMRISAVSMDLAETIDEAVSLGSATLCARRVSCRVNGPRPLGIIADPLLIGQAVLNLLLNAAEAMDRPDGEIVVTFSAPPGASDAKQFHLVVQDAGPGIPAHVLDRIFNPFFTTKETGTGLGLAIVHRIVEGHDGVIMASNAPAGGARFEIRI